MQIPVMKKLKSDRDEIEIHMLDVNDIWYVSVDSNRFVVYHTEHETYYQPNNMEQVLAFLRLHKFEKLDRGMVVNVKNIKHFNEEYGKVYFEEDLTNESKYATVSYSKAKKLKNKLGLSEDK
jgi:DNA-binding LytR/AlgR family response regulator